VLADAYAKGIRDYDAEKAYRYARNSSARFGNDRLGYTPGSLGLSYTLEYAYTDWCISRLAEWLGHPSEAKEYAKKGQAYRNIFDREKRWFRPRNEDGSWIEWPEEGRLKEWYGGMESDALQQGWFVPHDVSGMVRLMGGRRAAVADLEEMFRQTPQDMMWNAYYNHANEPVHFVPFLFNRLQAPWLTQYWTRFICQHAYKNRVEGLCGNEDVGQMSAWYVLSASGIHQACPGDTRVEITSPVFQRITFQLPAGKAFTIVAHGNSPENVYIQHARLNGKPYTKCHLDWADIVSGGTLELQMGSQPNKHFGQQ
jgi:predicted alpha-1,2-mannosidase